MKEIALYDARNQLSALIQEIEQTGGEVIITRHGKPVARLAPAQAPLSKEARAKIALGMLARRDARPAPDDKTDWRDLVGRRY